ncbi:MAG: cupin domain-containing protein [Acidobacteriota bacterium]
MDRRELLQAGLAALATAAALREMTASPAVAKEAAQGQPPAGAQSKPLGAHPLGAPFDGWQGTMLEVTYPPGAKSAAHQHPGPTFGFVISGRIHWAINGEPPRVIEAGGAFFEPTGSVHSTAANASETEPARLAVVILGKAGDPLSRPAAPPGA